jgi:hypothetical protein
MPEFRLIITDGVKEGNIVLAFSKVFLSIKSESFLSAFAAFSSVS